MTAQERSLLDLYLAGDMTDSDFAALQSLLRINPEARRMLRDLATVDAKLQELAAGDPATLKLLGPIAPESTLGLPIASAFNWFSLRTLSTLAAGLIVGVLSASVAWAIVVPRIKDGAATVMTLVTDSFEGGPKLLVTGVPSQTGQWSGDYAEIVGEQKGVQPESGRKMLRIVRADYAGKRTPEGSHCGDLFQLIDMRPCRHGFADGGAALLVSAGFNAAPFSLEERYIGSVSAYALSAEMVLNGSFRDPAVHRDVSLAMARKVRPRLDRDPRTWERAECELRLPSDAEFLLIHVGVQHATKAQQRVTFDAHYVDDVRVSLARRAPTP